MWKSAPHTIIVVTTCQCQVCHTVWEVVCGEYFESTIACAHGCVGRIDTIPAPAEQVPAEIVPPQGIRHAQ